MRKEYMENEEIMDMNEDMNTRMQRVYLCTE